MIEAPLKVRAMGSNARTLAVDRYTAEHAAETWRQLLEGVAPAVLNPTRENVRVLSGGPVGYDDGLRQPGHP
jgi:hypothetical protein